MASARATARERSACRGICPGAACRLTVADVHGPGASQRRSDKAAENVHLVHRADGVWPACRTSCDPLLSERNVTRTGGFGASTPRPMPSSLIRKLFELINEAIEISGSGSDLWHDKP